MKKDVGMTPYQKLLKQEGTVRWIESMQQSSTTPKNRDVGRGLQKIIGWSQSLLVSTVFGTVSSLHPSSFLMIFTLVFIQSYGSLSAFIMRKNPVVL